MKVVITCAGTGGHVNPGIAIADLIKKNNPKSDIIFIGTEKGIENDLVKKAGYEIFSIRTGKLLRQITLQNIKAIYNTYVGIKDSETILKDFKPDLVIGTGGYICGPVMTASKKLNIPYILHESNAFPGLTVKMLVKKAACVMVGFEDTKVRLNNLENIVYTGTPSKFSEEQIYMLDKQKCKKELKIDSDKKIIFITFGSQGAKFLNTSIINMIKDNLNENFFYILVTGKNNYDEVVEKVDKLNLSKYLRIEKFIYDMDKMYKVADLCITRSGALTINELSIVKKPSILIPLPYATENHQLYNAKVLEKYGCVKIVEEKTLKLNELYENIKIILEDEKIYNDMVECYEKVPKINVNEKIYEQIEKVIKNRGETFEKGQSKK